MAATPRWNLNEAEGRYASTGIKPSAIHLHLGLKRRSGAREPVGQFALDLASLARRGFVTERTVGGSTVYDVQIYREPSGRYTLGVRQSHTTPLEAFRVA